MYLNDKKIQSLLEHRYQHKKNLSRVHRKKVKNATASNKKAHVNG